MMVMLLELINLLLYILRESFGTENEDSKDEGHVVEES
jgi:hypothetical protein